MSHNIDIESNGRVRMAFRGERSKIWHKLGNEWHDDMTPEERATAAGLDWEAVKVPVYAYFNGELKEIPNVKGIQHGELGTILGMGTDAYKIHQPKQALDFCEEFVSSDQRFKMDTAGSLKGGRIIWAMASFQEDVKIAGDRHIMRLLMSTTFDASAASIAKLTGERVVCNNTLDIALGGDHRAEVRVRHTSKFDADKAARELEGMAQSIAKFKAMGDAMADVTMKQDVVSKYFKRLLEIPFDAKPEDVSTRKMNQFGDLSRAYSHTVQEGTERDTAWTALNAVTRYVDHDKSTRGGDAGEARFLSAQFGSGAKMKADAVQLLTADAEFADLLKRPFVSTVTGDSDVAAMLARPFAKV